MKQKEAVVVQFGQGQKIHLMEFFFIKSKGKFFPMSCGVERRWNVHGTYEHQTLTIADVDCKKCLARIEMRRLGGIE